MFIALLCVGMIAGGNNPSDFKKEIVKQIKKEYKVARHDAWVIADAVVRNSERYGVPVEIILSVIGAESAFNNDAVSPVGAVGLMQVMPTTAEYIAKKIRPGEYNIKDARTNIRFGTWYLARMQKKYNDWALAVRAYNCGPGRTDKVLAGKYDYPQETKDYHDKVMAKVLVIQMAMPFIVPVVVSTESASKTTGTTNIASATGGCYGRSSAGCCEYSVNQVWAQSKDWNGLYYFAIHSGFRMLIHGESRF